MAIFEDQLGKFVLLGELLQNVLRGRKRLTFSAFGRRGQTHVREKDLAELLGGVDVEPASRKLEDALTDALNLLAKAERKAVRGRRCRCERRLAPSGKARAQEADRSRGRHARLPIFVLLRAVLGRGR